MLNNYIDVMINAQGELYYHEPMLNVHIEDVQTNIIIRSHVACYSLVFVFANMTAAYLAYLIRLHSARLVFVFGANTNNYLYLYVTLAVRLALGRLHMFSSTRLWFDTASVKILPGVRS